METVEPLNLQQALGTVPWRRSVPEALRTKPGCEESQTRWWHKLQASDTMKYWSLMRDYDHVATFGLTDINYDHKTAEVSLIVDPKQTGKGFGALAFSHVQAFARQDGIRWIAAECYECNPNRGFWEHMGNIHDAPRWTLHNVKEWSGRMWDSVFYVFDTWDVYK